MGRREPVFYGREIGPFAQVYDMAWPKTGIKFEYDCDGWFLSGGIGCFRRAILLSWVYRRPHRQ